MTLKEVYEKYKKQVEDEISKYGGVNMRMQSDMFYDLWQAIKKEAEG